MSDQVSSLFSLAHSLLTLGQDGSPIYVDSFTRLNRDVYESALNSYGKHGSTPEAEAELCLGLLVAFNATMYDNGHKQEYIQKVLERALNVIIDSWGTFRLTAEQKEAMEELKNIEENPYPWEELSEE